MTDTPLAAVDQLAAFLQQPLESNAPDALLYLDLASNMVRDFLQQELDYTVDDVVLLDPVGTTVFLPELPVASVSLLETFNAGAWTAADPASYTVNARTGVVSALPYSGVTWPGAPASWRVTYTHGFSVIPPAIIGVVLGVAARMYASPVSVDSERIGGYQVKYSSLDEGFSAIEKAALGRYIQPRIA
jgi:hypothetical protein